MIRAALLCLCLTPAACAPNTHPEPDSAVMEPATDGSHWVTPAGTRVYLLHTAGMVCAVGESPVARAVAIDCLPEAAP